MTKYPRPFIGLLAFVLGCGPTTKPSEPAAHLSQLVARVATPSTRSIPAAEFTLTPEELAQQLNDDKEGTTERYRGKVIEMTGYLDRYIKTVTGTVQLCILPPDGFRYIFCNMPDPDPWDLAAPGQTVTIRGTFPDKFILPTLTDCVILKASGECRSRLTAAELGRRCAVDATAWKAELGCSGIVLEGIVEEAKEQAKGQIIGMWVVKFRTDTKYRVVAEVRWPYVSDQDRIRVGNRIRIVGIPKVSAETGEVICWGAFLATTD